MRSIRKNKTMFKVMAVLVLLMFASTSFASGLSVGRILPKGKVSLFNGNQKIGEFSSEAPFPEGTMLSVQGECGVKLTDLYLVAVDKSLFSVTTNSDSRKLTVQHGIVYFALSAMPHTLVFQTPDGVVTTSEVMLKAASNPGLLKGYVSVEKGITRVGVLEGGAMLVMVDNGKPMTVTAGHELRLAQADIFKGEEQPKEGAGEAATEGAGEEAGTAATAEGMSTAAKIGIGVAVLGAIGGIAAAAGGGGGGGEGSPSSP